MSTSLPLSDDRLIFCENLQHVVFFVLRAIDWIVPDVPESLELKVKREHYLAKQALAENQEALLVSGGAGPPQHAGTWTRLHWDAAQMVKQNHERADQFPFRSLNTFYL